jgi:hypothetical protein
VKFTKLKSPAMQILQSFKLVTYFQRFVINSPQNTDKFRAEKIEAFIFGMESEKNSKWCYLSLCFLFLCCKNNNRLLEGGMRTCWNTLMQKW